MKKKKQSKNQNYILMGVAALLIILIIVFYMKASASGDYKEGTYFGYAGTATSVVYVNEKGLIKSVFIDSAYIEYSNGACKDTETAYGTTKCVPTTKQILKEEYGMKSSSEINKEWYEQAGAFADKVVDEQGLEWLSLNDDATTDSVAGVTITVADIAKAVENALLQAEK